MSWKVYESFIDRERSFNGRIALVELRLGMARLYTNLLPHQHFNFSTPNIVVMARQYICRCSQLVQLARAGAPTRSVPLTHRPCARRALSSTEKPLPEHDSKKPGPNQEQLPHVSEEAAATSKVTGETGPELDQGTPVEEVNITACHFHVRS